MNRADLKLANELVKMIDGVEDILVKLEQWKPAERDDEAILDDKHYSLSISEFTDGSGHSIDLSRYFGNAELIEAIKTTLKKQQKVAQDRLVKL